MFKLRDYQEDSVKKAVEFLSNDKIKHNGFMVLPTGSGKSLVIANIAKQLDAPVLIFQPSKEILEQNFQKLQSYGVLDCSIYSASMNRKQVSRITFATIGSAVNNTELFKHFKYVIVDECHLVNPNEGMYQGFLKNLNAKIMGLTATPYRLGHNSHGAVLRFTNRTLKKVFHELIYYCQISTLMERGYLSPMKYYKIGGFDSSQLQVNSTGSGYTDRSIRQYYKEILFENQIIKVIDRLMDIKRKGILIFTQFTEEAQTLVDCYPELGAIVTGKTPKRERERILKEFKAGKIKFVANVGVLTTGFDYPELDTVVLARPTRSLALYYQMVGRAIRPHPNKEYGMVVDLCETFDRFGRVEHLKIDTETPDSKLYCVKTNNKQLTNVYF